jgi:hypothetical protein
MLQFPLSSCVNISSMLHALRSNTCGQYGLGVVVVILLWWVGYGGQLQVISEDNLQQGVVVETFQLGH